VEEAVSIGKAEAEEGQSAAEGAVAVK